MSTTKNHTAGRIAYAITTMVAWAISKVRPLVEVILTDEECEAAGLPYGSTEPAVYCWPVVGASRLRIDAWSDGAGCFNIDVLGWHGEVHFQCTTRTGELATL